MNCDKNMSIEIDVMNTEKELNELDELSKDTFVNFLHKYLGEYGDSKSAIRKSIDYAFCKEKGKGGFVLVAKENSELVGGLVMNKTGMGQYIPENVLVYAAVRKSDRGKGYGTKIIKKGIKQATGNVKLHVEYDNPAKKLYERLGFVNKYAEMRFKK